MSSYSGKGLSLPCKASDLHRNDLMNCGLHSTPALKPLCLQEMARVLGKEHLLARVRPGSPGQGVFLSTRSLPSAAPISCMILSLALSTGRTPVLHRGGSWSWKDLPKIGGLSQRTPPQLPHCLWASKRLIHGCLCRPRWWLTHSKVQQIPVSFLVPSTLVL